MREINTRECHVKFGNFIQEARNKQNLYQSEVAEKCGITQSYLSKLECGERAIDLVLAIKICEILNIDIQEFIKEYM